MKNEEKVEVFDKLIEFLNNEWDKSNCFNYSDGLNQFRQGYKHCLTSILNVINSIEPI